MGWFLSGNAKKKGRRSKASSGGGSGGLGGSWDPQRTLLGLRILGVGLFIGCLVGGWWYGQAALRGYVGQAHQQPLTAERIELIHVPHWLTPAMREHIQQIVLEHVSPDPLDGDGLRHAAYTLLHQSWIRQIRQIQRMPDGSVAVWATYREPVAAVRTGTGDYLVDDQGVVVFLPADVSWAGQWRLPVISGVSQPPPQRGELWRCDRLRGGLRLVQVIEREPFAEQVLAYNVGYWEPTLRRTVAYLHTDKGGVIWGLLPGEDEALQHSLNEKLRRLHRLTADPASGGRIDAGGHVVSIYGSTIEIDRRALPPGNVHRIQHTSQQR